MYNTGSTYYYPGYDFNYFCSATSKCIIVKVEETHFARIEREAYDFHLKIEELPITVIKNTQSYSERLNKLY